MENKKTRLFELDALRGLAALCVVLFHYSFQYEQIFGHVKEPYGFNFKYGSFGVQLFFMISGFVIYMSIINSKNVKEFALRRSTRLYPAYIVSVILTYAMISIFPIGKQVGLTHALLNLTMLQGYIPGVADVDGVYWTLAVEISFYVLIAILFAAGLHKNILFFLYSWLGAAVLIKSLGFVVQNPISHMVEQRFIITDFCNLFMAGIVFYHLKTENKWKYHVFIALSLIYEYAFHGAVMASAVFLFFLIFYALIFNKLNFLNMKFLRFFGTISYSLYLIHQNIGYIIIHFLESRGFISEFYSVIPITISIGLATAITYMIEKPIQNYVRKKSNAKKLRKSAVPLEKGYMSA